jgi:imidazolonepropionase-like amidohydrolase
MLAKDPATVMLWLALAAPASAATAFVDVSVVEVASGRTSPGQTVLVDAGRIAAMGPASRVALPPFAARIDGRGRFLMPGLADMHIHIPPEASDEASASREFALLLAYGVTTARVMIGQPEHLLLRDKIARGELLGPTLYVAGPPVGIAPGTLPGVPKIDSPEDARRVAAEQKKAGYDCVKLLDNFARDDYDALVAGAREAGLPVVGHVPDAVGLEHALALGQDSIEHLAGYVEALIPAALKDKAGLRLRDAVDRLELERLPALAEATRQAGVANTPTLFFWRALVSVDTPEELAKRPGLELVPARLVEEWAAQRGQQLARDPAPRGAMTRYHAVRERITKALSDAGARVLLGTDSPDFYNVPGIAALEELKLLVAAGLTPAEALRTGTTEAAAFMHGEREFGSVAPGVRADLLLLEANPLLDVGNVGRRVGVMVRGRWLSEAELRQRVAQSAP